MKTKFWNFSRLNLLLLLLFAATDATAFATRYVKVVASGLGDGSSWANASANLQAMIQASAVGDEIWVAAGTYKPTTDPFGSLNPTDPRDKTFYVKDGVKIYGSFAGTESTTSQRNIAANATILSGDIGTVGSNSDNCYHVVQTSAAANGGIGVTIDGFTIQGGNANGTNGVAINGNWQRQSLGGGIYTQNGTNTLTNNTLLSNSATLIGGGIFTSYGTNTLTNNTLSSNSAFNGGGIYTEYGTNTLTNNTLSSNSASGRGGGIHTQNGTNTLTNNTLSSNSATIGGGIYTIDGANTLTNNTLWSNSANYGGGVYVQGDNSTQNTPIVNCVFYNNTAFFEGGAIGYDDMPAASTLQITHSTFYNNTALVGGVLAITEQNSGQRSPVFTNCLLWGNSSSVKTTLGSVQFQNCLIQESSCPSNGTCSNMIYNQNPIFVAAINPNGADNIPRTADDGLRLQGVSPCINAGIAVAGVTTDILGNAYIGNPDLGAYEGSCALPTSYAVTGGGAYCTGGTGVAIGLANSETGVNYQLKKDGTNVGLPIAGTGNVLTFGNQTVAGTYTVSAIRVSNGCAGTMTGNTVISINPSPTVTVTSPNNAICNGATETLTANPVGGGGTFTYRWNDNSTNATLRVTPNANATYLVTVTDNNGCVANNSKSLTVNALPTVTVTSPNSAICNGATELLTANPSGGGGIYTYRWNDNSTNATLSVTPNANASYSVTVTDNNGCLANNSKSLTVNALLTVTVTSPNNAICNGATELLTANPSGGGVIYTYRWNDNSTNATLSVAPNANASYSVTVTDNNGCVANNSKSLIVNALPTVTVTSPNDAICSRGRETLTANPLGGGGTYTYRWDDNSTNSTVSVTPTANVTISVTITDNNGCVADNSKTLIVRESPMLLVRNRTAILCHGGTAQYTLGASLGIPPFQYSLNGVNYQSNPLFELAAGRQRIWTRDANNCVDSVSSVTIVQPDLLTVSTPTAAALVCYDGFTNLQATGNGGTTPYQYSLNGFLYQNANTFLVQGGTYQMVVKDTNGCQATSSLYNVVRPADLEVTTVTNPIKCWGDATQTIIQVANAVAPIRYLLNGVTQNNNPVYNGLQVGNYSVQVIDNRGCAKQASFTLTQPPLLTGSIEVDTLICKGKTTPIVVKTTGGTGTVLYSLNNGAFQNSLLQVGRGTHTVQIRDANQCLKTLASVKVEEAVAPKTDGLRSLPLNCHETNMRIYPNPASDFMAVDFKISQQSTVKLLVYNALGELVANKDYSMLDAGNYTTSWDTSNWAGQFVRVCLEVNGTCVQVNSMIIVH